MANQKNNQGIPDQGQRQGKQDKSGMADQDRDKMGQQQGQDRDKMGQRQGPAPEGADELKDVSKGITDEDEVDQDRITQRQPGLDDDKPMKR